MKQISILLIDDNPLLTDAYSQALSDANFKVTVTHDGTEGLKIIHNERPNIVLLDLRLHGVDGLTILDSIKKNDTTKDIIVIIFTMDEKPDTERTALKLGASLFLKKRTCSIKELIEHITMMAAKISNPTETKA